MKSSIKHATMKSYQQNKSQTEIKSNEKNPKKMVSSILTCLEVSTIYLRIFGSEEGMKQNCYFSYKSKDKPKAQHDLTISKSNVIQKKNVLKLF